MIELVVAHSEDPETASAVDELVARARAKSGGKAARAAVLFAGVDHDHAVAVAAIVDAFPGVQLIGCTTDGEVSSEAGFCEDSLLLLLFVGDGFEASAALGRGVDVEPAEAVRRAVEAARAGLTQAPRLCLTTPESLTCDAVSLLEQLRGRVGAEVPVIGGIAGDSWRFKRCVQFCGREVASDAVPVLLLAGDFKLAYGVASGWTPMGTESAITEVQGNVVARIGDRSAIEYYQHMLGQHVLPSGEFPLAVGDERGGFYLRAPVGYDLERGSVIFAGAVPPGARVQIAAANRDRIVEATQRSIARAIADYPGEHPAGALIVSCAARKQLLGTRTAEEHASLRRSALGGLPFAGFYAYGEICPTRAGEPAIFHNETFVTVVFGAA